MNLNTVGTMHPHEIGLSQTIQSNNCSADKWRGLKGGTRPPGGLVRCAQEKNAPGLPVVALAKSGGRIPPDSTPRKRRSMPSCRRGFTPRSKTHDGNAALKSGHKAPPTAEFLPVTGKTRFAAEAASFRLSEEEWRECGEIGVNLECAGAPQLGVVMCTGRHAVKIQAGILGGRQVEGRIADHRGRTGIGV